MKQLHVKETRSARQLSLIMVLIVLFAGLILVSLLSLKYGTETISLKTIGESFTHYDVQDKLHQTVRYLRLPRLLGTLLVGALLALSGQLMQAVTRNPLADPSILGVTGGASLAVAITYGLGFNLGSPLRSVVAMLGSLLAIGLIVSMTGSRNKGINPIKMALAGTAMSGFFSSLSIAIGLQTKTSRNLSFWLAGGFSGTTFLDVRILLTILFVCLLVTWWISVEINLLSLGDEVASSLGGSLLKARYLGLLIMVVATGASVAIAGNIGFIGLCIPHIVRLILGDRFQGTFFVTCLTGGLLLSLADLVARTINPPFEIPIGAITAIIGAPFFILLARKYKGGR